MERYSVYDEQFKSYGRIYGGIDTEELRNALMELDMPESGTVYVPSYEKLENLQVCQDLSDSVYGEMPIQIGYCCGYNSRLNCLEYHKDSELNYFTEDVILLLGKVEDIRDNCYNSSNVCAFYAPANVIVELYATTLHYCPVNVSQTGFRAACVLPKGTNTDLKAVHTQKSNDSILFMKNKWIIAHEDAPEVLSGVRVGIIGDNIELNVNTQ